MPRISAGAGLLQFHNERLLPESIERLVDSAEHSLPLQAHTARLHCHKPPRFHGLITSYILVNWLHEKVAAAMS